MTVRAGARGWRAVGTGVEARLLFIDPAAGSYSYLVRMAPGSRFADHDHPVAEECLVLEGEFRVGDEALGPGDYHVAPGGTRHKGIASPKGALLYIRTGSPLAEAA